VGTLAASYNSANVLNATTINFSGLSLSGAKASNYVLVASRAGTITAKPLTLSSSLTTNKMYDGSTAVVFTNNTLVGVETADTANVTLTGTGTFANKNVGTGIGITYSGSLSGSAISNYSFANPTTLTGNITVRDSITWVGGAGGEWFNPANWAITGTPSATGVVPDKSNVASVVVPQGTTISFDQNTRSGLAETGPVTVSNITYAGTASAGGLNIKNGSLTVNTAATLGALEGAAGTTLNIGGTLSTDIATSVSKTFAGVLGGAGDFTKAGAGTLVLTGTNTYTGATTVSAGTLQLGSSGTTGSLATSGVTNNGTLVYNLGADSTVPYDISGSGSVTVQGARTELFTFPSTAILSSTAQTIANNTTVAEVLARISGARENGINIMGGTAAEAGVYFKRYNAADNTATFQVQYFHDAGAGATYTKTVFVKLTQSGSNVQAAAYAGNGSYLTGYKSGTVATLGQDYSTGTLTGSLGLATTSTANGYGVDRFYSSAKTTFTGNNTYLGGTNITNVVKNARSEFGTASVNISYDQNYLGTVQVGSPLSGGALGTGSVADAGVLLLSTAGTLALPNSISGTGLVIQNGTGETQIAGALTHTGGTQVIAGTLQVGNGATAGSVSGDIVNNSTVKYNRTDDQTVTSVISGTGTLTKAGSNTLTLTSTQTYSGATAISAGQLIFQNNTRPTSTTFTGAGKLGIEPTLNGTFATALSTSTYSFANTLTGLSLGAASSTSVLTVDSDLTIAGPVSLYGTGVVINNNIDTRTGSSAGSLLVKSKADISLARDKAITSTGGNVVLWANSDGETSNGMVALKERSSISTAGGHVWIGGGSGTATFNGLTVGDGYATSGTAVVYEIGTNQSGGVALLHTSIDSGNGDIVIKGPLPVAMAS